MPTKNKPLTAPERSTSDSDKGETSLAEILRTAVMLIEAEKRPTIERNELLNKLSENVKDTTVNELLSGSYAYDLATQHNMKLEEIRAELLERGVDVSLATLSKSKKVWQFYVINAGFKPDDLAGLSMYKLYMGRNIDFKNDPNALRTFLTEKEDREIIEAAGEAAPERRTQIRLPASVMSQVENARDRLSKTMGRPSNMPYSPVQYQEIVAALVMELNEKILRSIIEMVEGEVEPPPTPAGGSEIDLAEVEAEVEALINSLSVEMSEQNASAEQPKG
jgi:hypothetical protein